MKGRGKGVGARTPAGCLSPAKRRPAKHQPHEGGASRPGVAASRVESRGRGRGEGVGEEKEIREEKVTASEGPADRGGLCVCRLG